MEVLLYVRYLLDCKPFVYLKTSNCIQSFYEINILVKFSLVSARIDKHKLVCVSDRIKGRIWGYRISWPSLCYTVFSLFKIKATSSQDLAILEETIRE